MAQAFLDSRLRRWIDEEVTLRSTSRVSTKDLAWLALIGIVAACAIAFVHVGLRIPGHAILRPVLPIAIGFAFAPRRAAGSILALASGLTAGVLSLGSWGELQLPAIASLLFLTPLVDLAATGTHTRGFSLLRFALAGAIANLAAFALKLLAISQGWSTGGGRGIAGLAPWPIFSFAGCGALAGLIIAGIWLSTARPARQSRD